LLRMLEQRPVDIDGCGLRRMLLKAVDPLSMPNEGDRIGDA